MGEQSKDHSTTRSIRTRVTISHLLVEAWMPPLNRGGILVLWMKHFGKIS